MRVQRQGSMVEVLPSSMVFWEALGLAPVNGPKNVSVYCVSPNNAYVTNRASEFLTAVTVAYESYKFGEHVRGPTISKYIDGMITLDMAGAKDSQPKDSGLEKNLLDIGKAMAALETAEDTESIVIYIINPYHSAASLWDICCWFHILQHGFLQANKSVSFNRKLREMVLQILPINYIASQSEPVMLHPSKYVRIASEIYDRCGVSEPPKSLKGLDISYAPFLHIFEPLPKSIPFKLLADPPSDLMNENAYMHVAYARSLDGKWLTAAWSDNSGKRQAHIAFCMEGDRSFADVAKEVWQITYDFIQHRRVTWKVIIVSVGTMEREEIDGML